MFRHLHRRIAIVVASTVALVPITASQASAQRDVAVASPAASSPADPREEYRGLFFGQGPVAEALSDNKDFAVLAGAIDANSTPEALEAADYVMDDIEAQNPGFFQAFSSDVRSGKPHLIKSALEDGGLKLSESGWALEEVNTPQDNARGVFVAAAVIQVVGAVTAAGAQVTVTLAVGANFVYAMNKFWDKNSASATSSLSEDEALAGLATSLAA